MAVLSDRYFTLEQVGNEIGVTREYVRQLEVSALRKCRAWCKARGLRLDELLPDSSTIGESFIDSPPSFDAEPAPSRHCAYCGSLFEPDALRQRYCSSACRHADSIEQCFT